jgi:hypothetical protein
MVQQVKPLNEVNDMFELIEITKQSSDEICNEYFSPNILVEVHREYFLS